MAALIRAAGGVVWRPGPDGRAEVCLVHRPRGDDWSLPKGKLTAGEHPLLGAVREVAEETGVQAVPQLRLPRIRYRVRDGTPKVVDYWAMRAQVETPFQPGSEVDRVAWLPVRQAAARASYRHDRMLLRRWAALPAVTAVVLLTRHAHAVKRPESKGGWPGPDPSRPLSRRGAAEAAALCHVLAAFAPIRVVSASPRRCVQTMAPLAAARDLAVEVESVFDETTDELDAVTDRLLRLAEPDGRDGPRAARCTVVCSQGAVIRPLLARLAGLRGRSRYATAKGDGWLLSFSGPLPLRPDRLGVHTRSGRPPWKEGTP